MDYFEHYELLPQEVKELVIDFGMAGEFTYVNCRKLIADLEKHGWTCDYDLCGEPYNLRPIKK